MLGLLVSFTFRCLLLRAGLFITGLLVLVWVGVVCICLFIADFVWVLGLVSLICIAGAFNSRGCNV